MIKDFSQDKIKIKPPKLRRDYQKKKFVNPYFKNSKKEPSFNTFRYLKIIAFGIFVYVLVYSDLMMIKQVELVGAKMIESEEFLSLVNEDLNHWYLIPQRHLLLINTNRLKNKINDRYNLNTLTIKRDWKKLKIIIEEKISYLIIYNQKNFYFIDLHGEVIRLIPEERIGEYWDNFPILNLNQENIKIGDRVASGRIVDFILRLDELVKKTNLVVHGYESRGVEEVSLVAKDGWRAYFDLNSNPEIVLENLILILNEKIENPKNLEYIDLRLGNKIFYK